MAIGEPYGAYWSVIPPSYPQPPWYWPYPNVGWICPKCNKGVAPGVTVCPCSYSSFPITTTITCQNTCGTEEGLTASDIDNA